MPTEVQNLRITPQSSTSLLVQWSPPAQINGILLGYMVRLPLLVLDCDQLTISLHFWSRHIKRDLIFSPYRVQTPLPGGA